MNITFFEFEPAFESLMSDLASGNKLRFTRKPLTLESVAEFADSDIIATLNESVLDASILAQLPALQCIVSETTGFDHIPLDYCRENNIQVTYVPHYGIHTVAEHAFSLLLALSHRILPETARARVGNFSPKGNRGFDLFGKTIGVVGTGNIGRNLVRIAKGFNMTVLGHDIVPDAVLAQQFDFQYVDKATLLAQSDIVTLHVPGSAGTLHWLDRTAIQQMRPGAIVVNTSRGTVVDIVALTESLLNAHLSGACLDVLPNEDILRNSSKLALLFAESADLDPEARVQIRELLAAQTLLQLPQVVLTPHSAYNTNEAIVRILTTTRENIKGFLSGQAMNVVPGI